MVTLILWKLFASLFVVGFVLTIIIHNMYSNSDVFISKHPIVLKIYRAIVTATAAFFLAASLSSIWNWF